MHLQRLDLLPEVYEIDLIIKFFNMRKPEAVTMVLFTLAVSLCPVHTE
jgi:hypothetical protein